MFNFKTRKKNIESYQELKEDFPREFQQAVTDNDNQILEEKIVEEKEVINEKIDDIHEEITNEVSVEKESDVVLTKASIPVVVKQEKIIPVVKVHERTQYLDIIERIEDVLGKIDATEVIDYENFFKSSIYLHFEEVDDLVDNIIDTFKTKIPSGKKYEHILRLKGKTNIICEQINEMAPYIHEFEMKAKELRTEIEALITVINGINNQKMSKEEFTKIKDKLSDTIEVTKNKREDFVVEEIHLNTKLTETQKEVANIVEEIKQYRELLFGF